jgi:hypothetical protein
VDTAAAGVVGGLEHHLGQSGMGVDARDQLVDGKLGGGIL